MKSIYPILVIILLFIPLTLFAEYQVGDHVEDFTLIDATGTEVSLYDFSDRVVVIPFWEAGCASCGSEHSALEEQIWQVYANQGVQILSVGYLQSPANAQYWINRYELTFPVLADENSLVTPYFLPYYGIYILPHTCIVSDEQILQYTRELWIYQAQIDEMLDIILNLMVPEIGLSTQSIEFDSVEIGQTVESIVYIDNIRTGILTVFLAEAAIGADFTVDLTPGEIYAVDDSMSMTLTFTPSNSGILQDSIVVVSGASTMPEIWINVSGTGYSNAPPEIEDLLITMVDTDVRLNWTSIPGVSQYYIYRSESPYFEVSSYTPIAAVDENTFLDADVSSEHFFYT